MKTLCIVPSGVRKIWNEWPGAGPTQARDAYTGPFSVKCKAYAERFYPDAWVILSAKYGFLKPEEEVAGPYNVSFSDPNSRPINSEQLKRQAMEKGYRKYQRMIVLGGQNYAEITQEVFRGREIIFPLVGCKGIGYMMRALGEAMESGQEMGTGELRGFQFNSPGMCDS